MPLGILCRGVAPGKLKRQVHGEVFNLRRQHFPQMVDGVMGLVWFRQKPARSG